MASENPRSSELQDSQRHQFPTSTLSLIPMPRGKQLPLHSHCGALSAWMVPLLPHSRFDLPLGTRRKILFWSFYNILHRWYIVATSVHHSAMAHGHMIPLAVAIPGDPTLRWWSRLVLILTAVAPVLGSCCVECREICCGRRWGCEDMEKS